MRALAEVKVFESKCGVAIEQFLNEVSKGSKHTETNYRGDLRRFFDKVFGKAVNTVTTEELDLMDYDSFTQYVKDLEEDSLSNNTINRHLSSIRSLMKYLKARNILKSDITYLDLVTPLRNNSVRIEGMTREVVLNYINGAGREMHNSKVKQKLIMFAVDTGLRMEDYLKMEWSQFTPQEDWVILRGYGKGGKEWFEKISFDVYDSLLELKQGNPNNNGKVFSPLNRKNIIDMMTRLKRELGYGDRVYSFHSFKKTAVTFTYRLTGDILEAMKKGKHSDIETTRGYIEEEEYGATGMFSLGDYDSDSYKNASHEVLLEALSSLNKDTLHLLNIKISNTQSKKSDLINQMPLP